MKFVTYGNANNAVMWNWQLKALCEHNNRMRTNNTINISIYIGKLFSTFFRVFRLFSRLQLFRDMLF